MKKTLVIQPDLFDMTEEFGDVSPRILVVNERDDLPLFTPDMIAKLDTIMYISGDRRFRHRNPMVEAYGPTADRFCKDCDCLSMTIAKPRKHRCLNRGNNSPHRINWPACSKFKEKTL